jgi:hypothetical protein
VLRNADFHLVGARLQKPPHISHHAWQTNSFTHSWYFAVFFHHLCCALVVKNDRKTPLVVKTALPTSDLWLRLTGAGLR